MPQHSPEDEPLERLLTDYRRDGVDSEGRFTLNPVRARELLEQFQLPEPAYYALHFTSFLIGSGAGKVFVESAANGLLFRAEGAAPLAPAVLESPFSALLNSGVEPYLSELALGLNTVLGQKATVELTIGDMTAFYSPTEIRLLRDQPAQDLSLLVRGAGNGERERQLVAEFFAFSPIPVQVAGREPVPLGTPSEAALQVTLSNPQYPMPKMPDPPLNLRKSTRARFSAVVRLGREISGVRVLHLGRLYTFPVPWSCQLAGWAVDIVINTDRFRKDLSQQTLRQDDTFKNIFESLRQQLESALASLPPCSARESEALALWDDVVESLANQGRLDEALERQTLLAIHLERDPDSLARGNALNRLGLLRDMAAPGSGRQAVQAGREILSQSSEPWQANLHLLRANVAFQAQRPDLEGAMLALAKDSRASPEDKLACFRWLRDRAPESSDTRAVYRCQIAQQMYLLGRAGLALAELDSGPAATGETRFRMEEAELRAKLHSELGQFEKALESLGRLLAMQREEHGQYDLRLGLTLTRLAAILDHLGKRKQAEEYREWSQRLHK